MKTCDVCGKEFSGSRVNQVTCSPACRLKKWKAKHETHKQYFDRVCRGCGKDFKSTDRRKLFCTGECKTTWNNAQRPTTQLEERSCVVCGTKFKPLQKRGVGRTWCSKECRLFILRGYKPRKLQKEIDRKKRAASYMRSWVANRGGHKRIDLKRKFGLTLEQYNDMFKAQEGKCAICGNEETIIDKRSGKLRMLAVDHNHSDGKIRKLLCQGCNRGLGFFRDDPVLLRKSASYLEE